ncbi:uncharacterized protein LOC131884408 [Tigriopus californicus]|uniref:uncharacterized protein LOC131884408 n=1 Tax=Tigriopus californicus TaxID=6832 RepID=UPI0027DA43DF|nr:uncharacterized protein LOC131884408 [Tigriopus californicus]
MGNWCSKEAVPIEVTHKEFVVNRRETRREAGASTPNTPKIDPDPEGASHPPTDKNEEESSIQPVGEMVTDDRGSLCSDGLLEPSNLPSSNDTTLTKVDPESNQDSPPGKSEMRTSIQSLSSSASGDNGASSVKPETERSEEKLNHIMALVKIRQDNRSDDSQSDDDKLPPPIMKKEDIGTSPQEAASQSNSTNSDEGEVDTSSKLELIRKTILPILNESSEMASGAKKIQSPEAKYSNDPMDRIGKKSTEPIHPSMAELDLNYEELVQTVQVQNFKNMKRTFLLNPDEFLTQNLALSVQFFRDHEKDTETLYARKKKAEAELRERLSETKQHAIISNQLFQVILDYVGYETKVYATPILEPIQPVEHYLVNECIEVNRSEAAANGSLDYSHVDGPYYRTVLETTKHKGYVKLQCVDDYEKLITRTNPASVVGTPPVTPKPPNKSTVSPKVVIEPPPRPQEARIFSPTRGHGRFHFAQSKIVTSIAEQDEEKEESDGEAPSCGEDLLRSLQKQMASNSNLSAWNHGSKLQKLKNEPYPATTGPPSPLLTITKPPSPPLSSPEPTPVAPIYESIQENNLYGYGTINPEKLDTDNANMAFNQTALDRKCFKKIAGTSDEDINDDTVVFSDDPIGREKIFLHSRHFVKDFKRKGATLANQVDISKSDWYWDHNLRFIQRQGRTDDSELDLGKENVSLFVPTAEAGFCPSEFDKWLTRQRCKIRDHRTGALYQWPQPHHLEQAKTIGCNLIPIGYENPKKNLQKGAKESAEMRLTWQVSFTRMENLIMKNWSQPKMRCYIFLMLFQKTLFQNRTGQSWLKRDHFRHIMFAIMEKNPGGKWIEEDLGKTLRDLFKSLNTALYYGKLLNYFMPEQNMLDTVPPHSLLKAKEVLIRLEECFSSYFMWCIYHLKAEKNFYPMPDVRRLYDILVGKQAKPPLLVNRWTKMDEVKKKDVTQQRMLQKLGQLKEKRNKEEESKIQQQDPLDPTRLDYPLQTIEKFDEDKRTLILDFFIDHFIQMAEKSNINRCYGQGLMYAMHCENLAKLPGYSGNLHFTSKIEQLRQVTRGNGRDYWDMNWDPEDGSRVSSRFRKASQRNDSYRKMPLPSPPKNEEVQRL